MSDSSALRVLFSTVFVRFFPELNLNTGSDSSVLPARICFALRFFRARTGQQSKPGKENKSTFSPPGIPDFGCLMCKRSELGDDTLTSFHVRSEMGEKDFSSDAKISPSLVEPKNDVSEAAHTTCLSSPGQSVAAMRLPKVIRSGNVMTRLVFGLERKLSLACWAPFRRMLDNLSEDRCVHDMPRIEWINFNAERYVRMEFGARFRE